MRRPHAAVANQILNESTAQARTGVAAGVLSSVFANRPAASSAFKIPNTINLALMRSTGIACHVGCLGAEQHRARGRHPQQSQGCPASCRAHHPRRRRRGEGPEQARSHDEDRADEQHQRQNVSDMRGHLGPG